MRGSGRAERTRHAAVRRSESESALVSPIGESFALLWRSPARRSSSIRSSRHAGRGHPAEQKTMDNSSIAFAHSRCERPELSRNEQTNMEISKLKILLGREKKDRFEVSAFVFASLSRLFFCCPSARAFSLRASFSLPGANKMISFDFRFSVYKRFGVHRPSVCEPFVHRRQWTLGRERSGERYIASRSQCLRRAL